MTENRSLENYFFNLSKKLPIHKWFHYFEIYERHFNKFINTNPNVLEIGVSHGGSLEMWNYYFDSKCNLYGIDINTTCIDVPEKLGVKNIKIDIGDQADPKFWDQYLTDKSKFDIVIDDGGHLMPQQIITFQKIYDHISENGVYLCEDVHTSYWPDYGGGLKNPNTFIEYSKNFIDVLNYYHIRNFENNSYKKFRDITKSIHFYDSVVVLEKGINPYPKCEKRS